MLGKNLHCKKVNTQGGIRRSAGPDIWQPGSEGFKQVTTCGSPRLHLWPKTLHCCWVGGLEHQLLVRIGNSEIKPVAGLCEIAIAVGVWIGTCGGLYITYMDDGSDRKARNFGHMNSNAG